VRAHTRTRHPYPDARAARTGGAAALPPPQLTTPLPAQRAQCSACFALPFCGGARQRMRYARPLTACGAAAWDKAFAFMKDTDNPILGGGGSKLPSDAAAAGDDDGGDRARAARAAGADDVSDPLRSDKFLRGFFG
jgi:hypothetical protein